MRNLDLYGIAKVNSELQARAIVVDRIPSLGEKQLELWLGNVSFKTR